MVSRKDGPNLTPELLLPRLLATSRVFLNSPLPDKADWMRESATTLGGTCVAAKSQGSLIDSAGESLTLTLAPSRGYQCPRCWQYHSIQQGCLCSRCDNCLKSLV